ncbi:CBS domain-containing protein [Candidatus Magnetominusculus dajiuhuensis]|uniref:CBS domain-containing protein n=1 Tax=Candidatus Magnetominusculus dajiuhuensis TaxID=3137712 RepID=UPI003B42F673
MDIITCHTNADFDCLSSMVAAKKLFPEAKIVLPGAAERPLREFLKAFPIEISKVKEIDISLITRLIIVDTKDPERIGDFKQILGKRGIQTFIYDHHAARQGDIAGTVSLVGAIGATATLLTEILHSKNIPLSPIEATILCLGIYEETGSMRFSSTTERDMLAAAYLLRRGADLNIVSTFIRPQLSRDDLELLNELLASLSEAIVHGIRVKIGAASRENYSGDAAFIAHAIMDMEDIDAVVLILNMAGKTMLIGRSRVSELNIGDVMRRFNGGGHPSAASASMKETIADIVKEMVITTLHEIIRPEKSARDVMTSPVISIVWDSTIKEAEALLTKYEINVLPVIKDAQYAGTISREIVEKALFHGFRTSKIDDFITTDAITMPPEAAIGDVEAAMVESNQRFLPVISGAMIIGAITRTDLLRSLYEGHIRRSRIEQAQFESKHPTGRSLATIMRERFPPYVYKILQTVAEVAEEVGVSAYLVGGSVRDLLRGEQNLDIDIVIEGASIKFASALSKVLNGKLKTHERFQTAKVFDIKLYNCGDFSIDIAAARTEYYESPAALPQVEMSSIKKDLYRRDFTINTLAVFLNKRDFGRLIDFFGAQRDLKERTVRVLHNLSFIEDPTRAFRAVRFSERFDFRISKHTERLIKTAIRFNLFEKLSGARLYDELMLIFREADPIKALRRLEGFGLLRAVHAELRFSRESVALFQRVRETISWYNLLFREDKIDIGVLYLMALIVPLTADDREAALQRLATPDTIKKHILLGLAKLNEPFYYKDPVSVYNHLMGTSLETAIFLMSTAENDQKRKSISIFLTEHKDMKPELKGNDLKTLGIPPGPIYTEIFTAILEEKLRGTLTTAEEELALVRGRFVKQ